MTTPTITVTSCDGCGESFRGCDETMCPACKSPAPGAPEAASELDALAEFAGLNLRLEHDDDAPMPWAVWGSDGIDAEDLLGAGESPSEAIEDARNTIRGWEVAS